MHTQSITIYTVRASTRLHRQACTFSYTVSRPAAPSYPVAIGTQRTHFQSGCPPADARSQDLPQSLLLHRQTHYQDLMLGLSVMRSLTDAFSKGFQEISIVNLKLEGSRSKLRSARAIAGLFGFDWCCISKRIHRIWQSLSITATCGPSCLFGLLREGLAHVLESCGHGQRISIHMTRDTLIS